MFTSSIVSYLNHGPAFTTAMLPYIAVYLLVIGITTNTVFRYISKSLNTVFAVFCVAAYLIVLATGISGTVILSQISFSIPGHVMMSSASSSALAQSLLLVVIVISSLFAAPTIIIERRARATDAPHQLRLRRALDHAKARRTACASEDLAHKATSRAELDELHAEAVVAADKVKALTKSLAKAQLSIDERDALLSEKTVAIKALETAVENMRIAARQAEVTAVEKEDELRALKATVELSTSASGAAVKELHAKIQELEMQVTAARDEVAHLNNTIDVACETIDEKDTIITTKDAIIIGHAQTIKDLKTSAARNSQDLDKIIEQLNTRIAELELEVSDKKLEAHRAKHAHFKESQMNAEFRTTIKSFETTVSRQARELAHNARVIESRNDKIAELTRTAAANANTIAAFSTPNAQLAALTQWNSLLTDSGLIPTSEVSWKDAWSYDDLLVCPPSSLSSFELADADIEVARLTDTDTLTRTTEALESAHRLEQEAGANTVSLPSEKATTKARLAQLRDAANAELQEMEGSVGVVLALDLSLSDEVLEAQRQALKAACASAPTKAQLAQLRIAADAELQAMEDSLTNTVLALDFDISDEALKAQQEELRAACAPTPTKATLTDLRDVASAELDDMEAKTGAPALQLDLSDSDVQRLQRELAAACSVSTDTIQASVSSPALSAAPLPALPSTSKTTQAKSATRAKPRATSKSSSVQKENRPLTSAAASRKTSGSKGLKAQNVKARSARGENSAEPQVSSRKGAGGGLPRRPLSALPLANCR